jgi:plastocyanin
MRRFGLLVLAVGLTAVGATACASAQAAERPVVYIDEGAYSPSIVRVPVGATVSWKNQDTRAYTVTSLPGAPRFDSGPIQAGEVYTRTFDDPGRYFYEDANRGDAQTYGEVVVGGGS